MHAQMSAHSKFWRFRHESECIGVSVRLPSVIYGIGVRYLNKGMVNQLSKSIRIMASVVPGINLEVLDMLYIVVTLLFSYSSSICHVICL